MTKSAFKPLWNTPSWSINKMDVETTQQQQQQQSSDSNKEHSKKRKPSFTMQIYIRRVFKELCAEKRFSLASSAVQHIEKQLFIIVDRIIRRSDDLSGKRATLGASYVIAATELMLPSEVGMKAIEFANKVLEKYPPQKSSDGTRSTMAARIGLVVPPPRIAHMVRKLWKRRVSMKAIVCIAAIYENLLVQLGNAACDVAEAQKRHIIKPAMLNMDLLSESD